MVPEDLETDLLEASGLLHTTMGSGTVKGPLDVKHGRHIALPVVMYNKYVLIHTSKLRHCRVYSYNSMRIIGFLRYSRGNLI